MTVHYQLCREDLIAFSSELNRFVPRRISHVYHYFILPLLVVTLSIVGESLLMALIFGALFICSGWLVTHLAQQEYLKDAWSEENIAVQVLPRQVTLSEKGFRVSCEASEVFYLWRFVREVHRSGSYVRFLMTPLETVHVPVRDFRSDEELADFLKLAQSVPLPEFGSS
jgi:hypothetical protein